jgi:hypothetical protein
MIKQQDGDDTDSNPENESTASAKRTAEFYTATHMTEPQSKSNSMTLLGCVLLKFMASDFHGSSLSTVLIVFTNINYHSVHVSVSLLLY